MHRSDLNCFPRVTFLGQPLAAPITIALHPYTTKRFDRGRAVVDQSVDESVLERNTQPRHPDPTGLLVSRLQPCRQQTRPDP